MILYHGVTMVWSISTHEIIFISFYLDSGFYQVMDYKEEWSYIDFFIPGGKRFWKSQPMGYLNSSPTFVVMMTHKKDKLYVFAKERGLTNIGSKVIVYDILLHARSDE